LTKGKWFQGKKKKKVAEGNELKPTLWICWR